MGNGALLQDGLALGTLEVFCIRKSVPFERVKTAKHSSTNTTCTTKHDRRILRWRHGSSKSQSPRVHPTSERGFVCGKVSDNITFGKKRKKARFSNCVGCFTTLFSVSGVSETEMVSSGAVDASMMGCSTPHDN